MIFFKRILLTLIATVTVAGCSTPKYRCSAVDGLGCTSVENVHSLAVNDALPDNQPVRLNKANTEANRPKRSISTKGFEAVSVVPGAPVLIAPRELRIWFNRWIDDAGDLHDESFLYIRLDNGRWALGEPLP
jgi:conjugal transfer pilus assembly protein TraV